VDKVADIVTPNNLFVKIGSSSAQDFSKYPGFEKFEEDVNLSGIVRYVKNPALLDHTMKIVRQIRNVYKDRNVVLAVENPINGENMRSVKMTLSSVGLRRTRSFKVYPIISKSSEVLTISDIIDVGVDGVIVDTVKLAHEMQASNLSSKSVLKTVERIAEFVKERKLDMIVTVADDTSFAKRVVEIGVTGVVTTTESFIAVKKAIADREAQFILNI
jgi:hypothetical protein